jgi:hypothetical protein
MRPLVSALVAFVTTLLRPRLSLQLEIVAWRPRISPADRILWSWMSQMAEGLGLRGTRDCGGLAA